MTSFVVRYDVIYHSFPVNSQYLMMWGVDSPVERATIYNKKKHQIQPSFIKRVTIHKILMATLFRMGNKARKRKKYFHMHDMHARDKQNPVTQACDAIVFIAKSIPPKLFGWIGI